MFSNIDEIEIQQIYTAFIEKINLISKIKKKFLENCKIFFSQILFEIHCCPIKKEAKLMASKIIVI